MTKTPQNIIDEQGRLETIRKPYESLKQLCVQLAYPGRSDVWDLFGIEQGKPNKGRKIYDPTANKGLEIWSTGIIGQYMPKDINWFSEEMSDKKLKDSKRVKQFMQDTDDHMRSVINNSGGLGANTDYYTQKMVAIKDAGCIGDTFTYIEEDDTSGKLMMLTPHPREFWVRRDFWGRIVCIHHKFNKTLQEIKDEFGEGALSETQKIAIVTNPYQNAAIIHGTYKNSDYEPTKPGIKNMPWQHYYVNVSAKNTIKEDGSYTLNPIPWSLNRPSHEQYGRGIVSQMLIEILTANFQAKDISIASQIAVRPPMLISSAVKQKLDLGAGGITFAGSRETQGLKMGDLVARMIDSSGYPFGIDNHMRWQQMIEDRFGVSLFLAMNQTGAAPKTAYEIRQRQAERATLMSPFLGTLGSTTDMEFDRMYSLELQSGRAPEPPQEVLDAQNGRIDIQYIGPLSQLLKQYYETGNLLTTIANIQAVLSVCPDSAVVIEGDELMRKILRSGNSPESIILSEQDVLDIKAIAAQQMEEQKQMMIADQMAKNVPNLSGKIENDSVLNKLMKGAA